MQVYVRQHDNGLVHVEASVQARYDGPFTVLITCAPPLRNPYKYQSIDWGAERDRIERDEIKADYVRRNEEDAMEAAELREAAVQGAAVDEAPVVYPTAHTYTFTPDWDNPMR